MENHKNKYLKYKKKYLDLKNNTNSSPNINKKGGEYLEKNDDVIKFILNNVSTIDEYYNSDEIIGKFTPGELFYGLNITMKLEDMEKIYTENKYIQLRPYQGEKILTIGCGNRRLETANAEPYLNNKTQIDDKRNYDRYHSHHNEFTIDMTLVANPSIVCNFNSDSKFTTIPDNSFNLIYFEGSCDPEINRNEIKRLLNNKSTSFCIGMNNGKYCVYSYYSDGEYYIQ